MQKFTFTLFVLSLGLILVGCNSINEKRAESAIKKYYQSLIDENYEGAFNELYLYDEDFNDGPTSLALDEAQTIYLEKVNALQDQSYKIKGYEISEVEYEDGHLFWHHLSIEVEQGTEIVYYDETVFFMMGN